MEKIKVTTEEQMNKLLKQACKDFKKSVKRDTPVNVKSSLDYEIPSVVIS